jgi:hypothetical protein
MTSDRIALEFDRIDVAGFQNAAAMLLAAVERAKAAVTEALEGGGTRPLLMAQACLQTATDWWPGHDHDYPALLIPWVEESGP